MCAGIVHTRHLLRKRRSRSKGYPQVPRRNPKALQRTKKESQRTSAGSMAPGACEYGVWWCSFDTASVGSVGSGGKFRELRFCAQASQNVSFAWKVMPNSRAWSEGHPQVPRSQPKGLQRKTKSQRTSTGSTGPGAYGYGVWWCSSWHRFRGIWGIRGQVPGALFCCRRGTNKTFARKVIPNSRGWSKWCPQLSRSQPKDIHREPGPKRVWIWGLVVQFLTLLPGRCGGSRGKFRELTLFARA